MPKFMKYFVVLSLSAGSVAPAFAQDNDVTPRQVFTSFVSGIPVDDLLYKPFELPTDLLAEAPVALPATPPDEDLADGPTLPNVQNPKIDLPLPEFIAKLPAVDPKTAELAVGTPPLELVHSIPELNKAKPSAESEKIIKDASLPPPPPEEPTERPKLESRPYSADLLPFYVSAAEYLKARDTAKHQQMTLTYTVTVANAKSGLKVDPKIITLTLGPDYAGVTKKDITRIFDFKTSRILTLKKSGDAAYFHNVSLFPTVLRNVDTVNKSTRKGQKSSIKIGPDTELDSFWLEAGIGWSARQNIEGLDVTRSGDVVSAAYKDKTALKVALNGPKIPTDNHMRALYAYWLHDVPVHPAILPKIGRPGKAPTAISILSYSPNYPDGLKTQWVLASSNIDEGRFPLPEDLPTTLEAKQTTPLAFVIAQRAKTNPKTLSQMLKSTEQKFLNAAENENKLEAWITGQTLAARHGGCKFYKDDLCERLAELESSALPKSDLAILSLIFKQGVDPKTREKALLNLLPFVEDDMSPAVLFKKAGNLRARLKTAHITEDKAKAAKADKFLEKALLNDPHDPETYRSLSQVYAARGQFAESWDLLDALRRMDTASEKLTAPVNKVEKSLKQQAPGYFVVTTP